jgi:hypothetical protein
MWRNGEYGTTVKGMMATGGPPMVYGVLGREEVK